MHWYVVEQYHRQLAKLGKTGGGERNSPPLPSTEDSKIGRANMEVGEEDPSQPLSSAPINNRKWLKGVALKKVLVSGAKRNSGDLAESAQPYLSVYERDGLLALIQDMLKSDLFVPDAPHTYPNPKQLLEELKEQLQCNNVEKVCATRPTGVGLVPAPVSRGSGRVGSRRKGGSNSASGGTPRKRARKICDAGEAKGMKVQKKDEQTSKRKVVSKRKQKPLLVSVPKSLVKSALDGGREEMLQNGSQGNGDLNEVSDTGGSELAPNKVEKGAVKDEEECMKVTGLESEELVSVVLTQEILTPPMSLSSAASISPSPSPSSLPPSSPLTPSSHPFTLRLELDSPITSCTTPISQTTPTSHSTALHLLSQQINKNSSEILSIESPMATSDSLSE